MPDETSVPTQTAYDKLSPRHRQFVNAYFAAGMNASEAARACKYADRGEGYRLQHREDIAAAIAEISAKRIAGEGENLLRLSTIARADMRDFYSRPTRVRPRYEERPLHEKLDATFDAIARMEAFRATHDDDQAARAEREIERLRDQVVALEWDLAMNPRATYRVEVGVEEYEGEEEIDLRKAEELGLTSAIRKLSYNAQGRLQIELHDSVRAQELIGRSHGSFTDKVETSGPGGGPVEVRITRTIVGGEP